MPRLSGARAGTYERPAATVTHPWREHCRLICEPSAVTAVPNRSRTAGISVSESGASHQTLLRITSCQACGGRAIPRSATATERSLEAAHVTGVTLTSFASVTRLSMLLGFRCIGTFADA